METSTENKEHNASERWQRQQSRCRLCLLYNDLVLHADVQLLLEAWGMLSYAGKHCTQQPIQFFSHNISFVCTAFTSRVFKSSSMVLHVSSVYFVLWSGLDLHVYLSDAALSSFDGISAVILT